MCVQIPHPYIPPGIFFLVAASLVVLGFLNAALAMHLCQASRPSTNFPKVGHNFCPARDVRRDGHRSTEVALSSTLARSRVSTRPHPRGSEARGGAAGTHAELRRRRRWQSGTTTRYLWPIKTLRLLVATLVRSPG